MFDYFNDCDIEGKPLRLTLKDFKHIDAPMAKLLYLTALPVVLNEACWGLANVTYTMIYGHIGVNAIATTQITSTIMNLFTIVIFGMAHASVVLIGNEIEQTEKNKESLMRKKLSVYRWVSVF